MYAHLTDATRLLRWIAVEATVDATPGGELRWTHENGATVIGRFLELVPSRRGVFTYGWDGDLMGLPPGSSVVEIDLVEAEGKTTLRLSQRSVPPEFLDAHQFGWEFFMGRLQDVLAAE